MGPFVRKSRDSTFSLETCGSLQTSMQICRWMSLMGLTVTQ